VQVLKEEIRNSILLSAKMLFLEYGYLSTSMDKIAKKAGISKSNLYNYFEKKEDIFEILTKNTVYRFIEIKNYFVRTDFDLGTNLELFVNEFINKTGEFILNDREIILLLIDSSSGTKYERMVDDMIDIFAKKFARRMKNNNYPELIAKVLATSLIQGIVSIIKFSNTKQEIIENLSALFIYHTNGIKTLIV